MSEDDFNKPSNFGLLDAIRDADNIEVALVYEKKAALNEMAGSLGDLVARMIRQGLMKARRENEDSYSQNFAPSFSRAEKMGDEGLGILFLTRDNFVNEEVAELNLSKTGWRDIFCVTNTRTDRSYLRDTRKQIEGMVIWKSDKLGSSSAITLRELCECTTDLMKRVEAGLDITISMGVEAGHKHNPDASEWTTGMKKADYWVGKIFFNIVISGIDKIGRDEEEEEKMVEYWNCPNCAHKWNGGRERTCPTCGFELE
jgi:hypothetical protein